MTDSHKKSAKMPWRRLTGLRGPPGPGLNIDYTVRDNAELKALKAANSVRPGEVAYRTDDRHLYVYDVSPDPIDPGGPPLTRWHDAGSIGTQGPAGPPGPHGQPGTNGRDGVDGTPGAPSQDARVSYPTGAVVGGNRAVYIADGLVRHADQRDPLHAAALLGVTTQAQTTVGADVEVQIYGNMQENSWNWTPGPVYLGTDGQLTQASPAGGGAFVKEVGVALNRASLFIRIFPEIKTA